MTHGSLFSGIGGFDLAAEWMGWENKFHCEWNEFGQKVLHYYWPNAELFTDITKSDFTKYANKIDVLTGGFPCQPYSTAGKRLGKEDERHLWPHMYRAIQEIKPRWIVGENVRGLISWNGGLVFEEVQTDLEAAGYEVQPFLLPACGVNAPHRRDRVWFVAYSNNEGGSNGLGQVQKENGKISKRNNNAEFSNTNNGASSDSNSRRWGTWSKCELHNFDKWKICQNQSNNRNKIWSEFSNGRNDWDASNTCDKGLERSKDIGIVKESRKKWNKQFTGQFCTTWENFPTVSPICNGNDGLSNRLDSITFSKWRNESIKAGGNAIVPQVVYQIFKTIEVYEHQKPSDATD